MKIKQLLLHCTYMPHSFGLFMYLIFLFHLFFYSETCVHVSTIVVHTFFQWLNLHAMRVRWLTLNVIFNFNSMTFNVLTLWLRFVMTFGFSFSFFFNFNFLTYSFKSQTLVSWFQCVNALKTFFLYIHVFAQKLKAKRPKSMKNCVKCSNV